MTARLSHPLPANVTVKLVVVNLSVVFIPPFLTYSHRSLFQLICYSVGHAGCLPIVDQANTVRRCYPPLTSDFAKVVTVSFGLFFIPPSIPNAFSPQLFLIACFLPSVNKANNSTSLSSPTLKSL
jgi:hypothetical protein